MKYKLYTGGVDASAATLNDRQIRVIASDATLDRVGDILDPSGCVTDQFDENPIVLANHDPNTPVGTADVSVTARRVEALIEFAPPRISPLADTWCGLAKAGVLRAVSVGFSPIESEPIRGAGVLHTKWELLELSIVSVPCNPNALVIERSASLVPQLRSSQPSNPWVPGRARDEYNERMRIRAAGERAELDHDGWTAYLHAEFPHLSREAAHDEWHRSLGAMTPHERFLDRAKRSEFAKRQHYVDEIRQDVCATIEAVEDEPPPPYWTVSPAEFSARMRADEERRINDTIKRYYHS